LLAAAVATLGAAACSDVDILGSSADEVTGERTWKLSPDALAAGKQVKLAYDAAPLWTGSSACSGRLREGARDLGVFLGDRFSAIDTVGGYACRKNTADSKRMSVHGTGRALDLMISTVSGGADTVHGDPIANYLVQNAQRIGIQLIIWNHTVWRANGTNTAPYTGPIPHIDHIHVELTSEAASRLTPWFQTKTTDDASIEASVDASMPDADRDAGNVDDDDASVDPEPEIDAAVDAAKPEPAKKDASAPDAATTTPKDPDEGTSPQDPGGPADGYSFEVPDGEPAKEDAIGPRSKHSSSASADDGETTQSHGCSAAPVERGSLASFGLAMVIGLGGFVRRRAKRDRRL
jgi:hypothetical protein